MPQDPADHKTAPHPQSTDPVLAEVLRGGFVESCHRGAYAVVGPEGRLMMQAGNIDHPIFPRSAIKALQCLAIVEGGGASAYGFGPQEVALACASHNAETVHTELAFSMLAKIGLTQEAYACGPHWPFSQEIMRAMARNGETPTPVHNNCSGKHAGMLALSLHLTGDHRHYEQIDHPVQRNIARTIDELCDCQLDQLPCATDGCSAPIWAIPLRNLASGFARFMTRTINIVGEQRFRACQYILDAVRENPFLVAGSERFCTKLMTKVPRAYVKIGAEGVVCGGVPHAAIGFALKCADGAGRAAEVAAASLLARLDVWEEQEREALQSLGRVTLYNWRQEISGEVRSCL